jgi:cytoskeletal protein RodZ
MTDSFIGLIIAGQPISTARAADDDRVNPGEKTKDSEKTGKKPLRRSLQLDTLLQTMRRVLYCAVVGALTVAAWGAQGTVSAPAKKAPAKAGAAPQAHSTTAAAKKPVSSRPTASNAKSAASTSHPAASRTTSAAYHGARKAPATPARTTWRARQMAPAPERYKEIQEALVAKGYLSPEAANGSWNTASTDALKRFQGEQNLESSGKINSLSLIALGLGPRHDSLPAAPQPQPAQDFPPSDR